MILVTGASGFIGSHVVDAIVARGDAVRAMVAPGEDPSRLEAQGVEICFGDLRDEASLAVATRGVSLVLHCAAKTGPWGAREEYEAINVRGLEALTRVAMAAGVRRLTHVSSTIVHGIGGRGVLDESGPFHDAPNPYTRTKIAGERLLRRMMREEGARVTIVRPGLVYGPRDANSFGRFAHLIAQGKMPIMGSGQNHVPLIYVADVAQGILLAAETPGALGRAYVLVNDEPVTQHEYLNAIASALGVAPPTLRIPYHLALGAATVAESLSYGLRRRHSPLTRFGVQLIGAESRFSIQRARAELSFSPRISLAEGVRLGLAWYLGAQPPLRAASTLADAAGSRVNHAWTAHEQANH